MEKWTSNHQKTRWFAIYSPTCSNKFAQNFWRASVQPTDDATHAANWSHKGESIVPFFIAKRGFSRIKFEKQSGELFFKISIEFFIFVTLSRCWCAKSCSCAIKKGAMDWPLCYQLAAPTHGYSAHAQNIRAVCADRADGRDSSGLLIYNL